MPHNKQFEPTVTRRRVRAASAPFQYALAARWTAGRAAAQLRRYASRRDIRARSVMRSIILSVLSALAMACTSMHEFSGEVLSADLSQTPVDGAAVLKIAVEPSGVAQLYVGALDGAGVAAAWNLATDPSIVGRRVHVRAERDDARDRYFIAVRGSIDVLE